MVRNGIRGKGMSYIVKNCPAILKIKSALEEIKKMVTNPYPGEPRDVLDIINGVLK